MAEPKRLPSRRWKVRYREPLGRPRSKVCDTKAEARAWVEEIGHAGRHREWIAPERGRMLLAEWVALYLSTVVHLRPTSVSLYEREFAHILRRFGNQNATAFARSSLISNSDSDSGAGTTQQGASSSTRRYAEIAGSFGR